MGFRKWFGKDLPGFSWLRTFSVLFLLLALARLLGSTLISRFYVRLPVYTQGQALESAWIFGSALNKVGFFVSLAGVLVLGVFLYRRTSWAHFTAGIRWFVLAVVFVLLWRTGTFSHNYFHNQAYWLDRLTLLGGGLLTVYHPAGLLFFLTEYFVFTSQFNLAVLGATPLVNAHLAVRILMVFLAFLVVRCFWKLDNWMVVYAFLLVVGVNYYHAGLQKMLTGEHYLAWPFDFSMEYFFGMVRFRGWARVLSPGWAREFFDFYRWASPLLITPVFLLELSSLVLFVHRKLTIVQLLGFSLFHCGFFLFSGLFYWMWAFVDLALLVLVLTLPEEQTERLFNRKNAILGVFLILIVTEVGLIETRSYSWWNTRYTYAFNVYAVTSDGESVELRQSTWRPHGQYFLMGYEIFGSFLVDEKLLPSTVSTYRNRQLVNRKLEDELGSLERLKNQFGTNRFNSERARRLERVLRSTVKNQLNGPVRAADYLSYLGPPAFAWSDPFGEGRSLRSIDGEITAIRIEFKEGVYRDRYVETVSQRLVRTIPL